MSNFLNKIPVSPITSFGNPSVPNGSTIGTNFSILQTGGYMEVYTLSGLTYTIPPSTTGIIEFSGNSIPIQFTKGSGSVFSPDVLTLNSDNISSGRRKLGMLAYVYETNKIYQFRIDNYETLWNNATGATGPGGSTVVISDFGTTVKNNSPEGQSFINVWTASTISGIDGYDDTNASWRVLSTGGSGGASITGGTFDNSTDTLTLNNSTGGTITITGFTDIFVTGGTYSAGTTTFTNNTGGTFQVSGYTKQGDYVESVTGDGVDNTDPLNPIINQNAKVNVITVTLGDLGLLDFTDNETMLLLSNSYLNSLNEDIPYDTLYQLEIIEGTGNTPTFLTTFVSRWNVVNNGDTIILPYEVSGSYTGSIDWGDGTITTNSYSNRGHVYTNSGTYTIKINGVISGFSFLNGSSVSRNNIHEINQWGNLSVGNSGGGYYFFNCNNLVLTGVTDTLNLSGTTNLKNMFQLCTSITTINNLNDWDVSNVTDMGAMFYNCNNFNQNIGNWDVSKVTRMIDMFHCPSRNGSFNNGGSSSINNWNVSGVTNMGYMFFGQPTFNQPIGNWNVSKVTYMDNMLAECYAFNQNIGNWDVSKVTNMFYLFKCGFVNGSFNNGGSSSINNWNVSGVTNMSYMFLRQVNFNQPLSGWNVSKVVNISGMFANCQDFNQNINNWDVSKVTNMNTLFNQCSSFNQPLSGWNVSGVTDMTSMFSESNFNQPINNWNVSNVTQMNGTFANSQFNQPLSGWDVSKVIGMSSMFTNSKFNQPIGNWNVSKVTDMTTMFGRFSVDDFNQDIGNWNISGVTNFTNFMNGKTPLTFSTTNLDAIYNGWSTKNPKTGITINFGTAKYTSAGSAGKSILTGSTISGGYGWTITDGGI
jgi:surface protein